MIKQMMLVMSSVVMFGIAGCATDDAKSDDGVQTSETSADSTECWSVAGLYWDPCGTVREDVHAGEQIDILDGTASCGGNAWQKVTHHATGHQGWIRVDSICN